jgi:hypothetical protein
VKKRTEEEKVAKIIVYAVNDLTLDLELVGEYISEISSSVLYNRLDTVFESAQENKLSRYGYNEHEIARMRLAR